METPDLGALLAEVAAFTRGSMTTAIPATVLAYDPVRQLVTVKPTVSGRYHHPDSDQLIPFPLPAIANVPVAFPSSSGFSITWPLLPGDTVYLVIADSSLDEWKSTGAAENIPIDTRRFDLTDAVAIPGLRSIADPIPATGVSATAMVIAGADIRLGSVAATDFVALSAKVMVELNKIIQAFNVHAHVAPGTSPPAPLMVPASTVAAVKVKAE